MTEDGLRIALEAMVQGSEKHEGYRLVKNWVYHRLRELGVPAAICVDLSNTWAAMPRSAWLEMTTKRLRELDGGLARLKPSIP